MTTNTNWNQLREDHEIAYLRGDLATSSPESYTLEELKEISEGMDASTAEKEEALKADFDAMPTQMQARMLDMLSDADPEMAEWWRELLVGKMPESVESL